jgi:hypothetical protein
MAQRFEFMMYIYGFLAAVKFSDCKTMQPAGGVNNPVFGHGFAVNGRQIITA